MAYDNEAENDAVELPTRESGRVLKSAPRETQPSLAELQAVLVQHARWLRDGDDAGARADLTGQNLCALTGAAAALAHADTGANIDLQRAELRGATLIGLVLDGACFDGALLDGAVLSRSSLVGAGFRGAQLRGADFAHTNVSRADFAGADLTDATFTGSTGLSTLALDGLDLSRTRDVPTSAFARRDTRGVKLSEKQLAELLESAAPGRDASRNARNVFYVMLLSCLYCLLTLSTVTDEQLIENLSGIVLPILNISIAPYHFFMWAPLLLLLLFFELHAHLRQVWKVVARLPTSFPDGTTLVERTSPWLLTTLVDHYGTALPARERSWHRHLARILAPGLGFWAVPVTIGMCGGRYLTLQNPVYSALHAVLLWISISAASIIGSSTRDALSAPAVTKARAPRRYLKYLAWLAILLAVTAWCTISDTGCRFFAAQLPLEASSKTEADACDLTPDKAPESIKTKFDWQSFVGAHGRGAYLCHATLRHANLTGANLERASLQGASLYCADLRRAKLSGANLTNADLSGANLSGADLRNTTGLTAHMLERACGDPHTTRLPGSLQIQPCPAPTTCDVGWGKETLNRFSLGLSERLQAFGD